MQPKDLLGLKMLPWRKSKRGSSTSCAGRRKNRDDNQKPAHFAQKFAQDDKAKWA
jgi:hypothetical protein